MSDDVLDGRSLFFSHCLCSFSTECLTYLEEALNCSEDV